MSLLKTAIATTGAVHLSSLPAIKTNVKATERFQGFMLHMAESIESIGFTRLANLYSDEYYADRITEAQCRSLRFQLAMKYENLFGMERASKFMGVERVVIEPTGEHPFAAMLNRSRLATC